MAILKELLKNGRQSDREISRHIGISQPTVSRGRRLLEREYIQEYAAVPQLLKLGFTIIAFTRGGTPLPNHDLSTLDAC
jgi:DNA-binding Lrp family transcriptional regulator